MTKHKSMALKKIVRKGLAEGHYTVNRLRGGSNLALTVKKLTLHHSATVSHNLLLYYILRCDADERQFTCY